MSGFKYPRGSEWRMWDLHVHTRSDRNYKFSSDQTISKREQDYGEYPKVFIEHIHSVANLGTIAITDHNEAGWIDRIMEENEAFRGENECEGISILPGVEVESSDGIHLLVVFNTQPQSEQVRRDYRRTTWKETIEHFLTAIQIAGTDNARRTTEGIMEEAERWDGLCVFAHVATDKGFFEISSGKSKKRIYKHRLTQIFQIPVNAPLSSGQENIVKGADPEYCDGKGDLKSVCCITAGDAKSLADIGRNNLWIKADPTFEGLKQVIFEPEQRVYIGEEPPSRIEGDKVIESITISNSNKWFEAGTMPLNEGQISVIGGKGTGKTAILDLIAYAAGSYHCSEQDGSKSKSFLRKAFKELKGTKIRVGWKDGSYSDRELRENLDLFIGEGKVRYLPQDYVDQLCSELGKTELEKQIENVIFQKVPPEDKAAFTDFKSYKDAQLKVTNDKKDRATIQIQDGNLKVHEHRLLIESRSSKTKEMKRLEEEIERFQKEMSRISGTVDNSGKQREILSKLQSLTEEKSGLEKRISQLKTDSLRIEGIMNEISIFREKCGVFLGKLRKDLEDLGVRQEVMKELDIVLLPKNLEEVLDETKETVARKSEKHREELRNTSQAIEQLSSEIVLETSKQEKIKKINSSVSALRKKKDSLATDIQRINDAEKELPQLLANRESLLLSYFDLIFEEKEKLREIYSPLVEILKASGEENKRLFDFAVRFNFDVDSMADEGHELLDLRAEGIFRQSRPEALREKLEELRFELNLNNREVSDTDKASVREFPGKVEKLYVKEGRTIASQLKGRYTEQDFDDWLYHTKYYSIGYSIKFDGIELDDLSPGLKGVALLILFLELDREDRRPILIDQPEENLDNRSVYHALVRYFKEAKKRRQVIIVTHNPNLVVNTDSEQVLVADFDRGLKRQDARISYVSGSLENTFKDDSVETALRRQGIREHVCEILEGGQEAFEKRERKYGFGSP